MNRGIFLLLLLAMVFADCDFTVRKNIIDRPGELSFEFTKHRQTITVCFELSLTHSQQDYLLRLDYLPFQCLNAKNDNKMIWSQEKEKYWAQVEVRRQCKKRTLGQDQQEQYRLIYEFREGYDKGGILVYNELVHKYLPTLLVIFCLSVVAERFIFGSFDRRIDKID